MNLTLETAFYIVGIAFMVFVLILLIIALIAGYFLYQRIQRTKTLAARAIQTGITGQILRVLPTKGWMSVLALIPMIAPFWKRMRRA
jgi:hypothetical protein